METTTPILSQQITHLELLAELETRRCVITQNDLEATGEEDFWSCKTAEVHAPLGDDEEVAQFFANYVGTVNMYGLKWVQSFAKVPHPDQRRARRIAIHRVVTSLRSIC